MAPAARTAAVTSRSPPAACGLAGADTGWAREALRLARGVAHELSG